MKSSSLHLFGLVLSVSLLASIEKPARAGAAIDTGNFGYETLGCFYPDSQFVKLNLTSQYTNVLGLATRNGSINFRLKGSSQLSTVAFLIHDRTEGKEHLRRVTPIADNVSVLANPMCFMKDWHRVEFAGSL